NHVLGDLFELKRARGIDHHLLINLDAGERSDRRAGRDHDIPSRHGPVADFYRVRAGEGAKALEPLDLVLLEQKLDPAGKLLDRVEALAVHGWKVELGLHLDTELGEGAAGSRFEIFRRMEHRLGRDASDIQAGTAQSF